MTLEDKALDIPAELGERVAQGQEVIELARLWWGGTAPYMVVRPGMRDPAMIGTMLAELSWYFAGAYADLKNAEQAETFEVIKRAWDDAHAKAADARAEVVK